MKSFLSIIFFLSTLSFSQNSPVFSSPSEIKSFADFLFCSGDYFRASLEYEKYLKVIPDDTTAFKAALGYSNTENYDQAEKLFLKLKEGSALSDHSAAEYFKIFIYRQNYNELINAYDSLTDQNKNKTLTRLYYSSFLLGNMQLPSKDQFSSAFDQNEKEMTVFYERKADPDYKNPVTAGILSAVIPGAGKIYTGRYGDGITAFLATGVLTFLSVDNFRASHNFRGWLFAGLAALFYAGNIYGSAASANDYNIKERLMFEEDVKSYLREVNYFTVEYEFCR